MHRGRPAAGHQNRVAGDDRRAAHGCNEAHAFASAGAHDPRVGPDRDARAGRPRAQVRIDIRPVVENARDRHTRLRQGQRGVPRLVVRGRDHCAAARKHAVTRQERRRRARQHDPRTVVARKYQRTFDGARRDRDAFCPHEPEPFARQARIGCAQMVGHAFHQRDHAARIPAKRGRPGQHGYPSMQPPIDPFRGGHAVDCHVRTG